MIARAVVRQRPGALSIALIAASILASVSVSLAMDVVLIGFASTPPIQILTSAVLFNVTCVLQSVVGAIIEWQRPGHRIGRLLMLSGPLYALLAAGWLTFDTLQRFLDPQVYRVVSWGGSLLSYPGVALLVGWVPLLFPTGNLPGPRWRIPAAVLVVLSSIGLVAWAVRPSWTTNGRTWESPIGLEGWPAFLEPFVDAIPFELLALVGLAVAALVTRYRRGDRVERLQVKWFGAAVALCGVGLAGVLAEIAIRTSEGPLVSALVSYTGILAMPIAIGIAVTRYGLYELDRLISRTIGWTLVTGVLLAIFASGVLALQAILAVFAQGQTLAVAASTLGAFALFQPVRRRVQSAVDRRFDRARYDGERTASAFSVRMRDATDLPTVTHDFDATVRRAIAPSHLGLWLRGSER